MDDAAPPTAAVAVVLSFAAGATDAFAFLQLGRILTANMTGNLILVGLYQRPNYTTTLIGALVAVVVFALVTYLGFRLADPARRLLIVATAAQVAVLAGYAVADRPLGRVLLCVFIAL